jgi:actin-like ATPase involved in cell morphogenesis
MNGIVTAETSRTGGLQYDEAIVSFVRRKYGVIIGQPTAEQLRFKLAQPCRKISSRYGSAGAGPGFGLPRRCN